MQIKFIPTSNTEYITAYGLAFYSTYCRLLLDYLVLSTNCSSEFWLGLEAGVDNKLRDWNN